MPGFGISMRRVASITLGVFAFSAMLLAQSTTEGAIGGTVTDTSGAVIAHAQVVIHNDGTNADYNVTTDESGYYRSINLQPGSYTLSIKQQGFATFTERQVIVEVGSLTQVSPKLKVAGTAETIDVTAEAPQINYTSPEFAPTLNQTAISNLPINGGRWSNFAVLTPGVVSDSNGFGLLSFRGISSLLNNNTVDGGDNNQAFFSEERGRTRVGYSTPKTAVEEFQVNTSNYSSEYGRSAGAVINTVTKSGTNSIHGEGYFYDRDNVWGAANEFTKINVQTSPGVFTPVNFKPTDWRKMAGFGVGGPLIKDKLFLFVAYDWFHRNFPGTAVASNPTVFFGQPTCSALDTPGNIVFPCTPTSTLGTLATRLGTTQTDALAKYNSGLAGLNTMLGPVPRNGEQNILFPKLDWTINSKNHASFSFNRMRWSSPAGIQTQATNTNGIASFGNDFVKDTWGVAKLDTSITANLINQARFQYGRDFEFEFTQPPTPYEVSNLVNTPSFTNPLGLPPAVSITNGFSFGVPTFLQRAAFPDETRIQVADTVSWNHDKHSIKFGYDMSHVDDNAQNLRVQFGSYSYSSLLNYFSDFYKPNSCGKPCYSSYQQAFGPLGFEFTSNDYAMFFEDDWKILPRLNLSMGLRYEYQQLPKPFANLVNPLIPQTGKFPNDQNNFGPRLGFAWDVTGSGDTVIRAGYGIYYGRIINSAIYNALINTGMPGGQFSFFFTPTTAGAPSFPTILPAAPGGIVKPNVVFFDKHFQNPQIQQFDITMERSLGWRTVLSISYLGSLGRELPGFADTNIAPATGTITYTVGAGGPLTAGSTLTEPLFTSRINTAFNSMTDIFSGINSTYHALVLQVNHRMSHHIQFGANYTLSKATDFGQNQSTFSDTNDLLVPGQIAPEKGPSINDVPHRFVAYAVATSPWKKTGWLAWFANDWEFSPIYQWQNGLPYTLRTAGTPAGGLGSSINGSGGDNRIDVIGRNTFRFPTTWVADMRLAKSFTFAERYKLELSGDFFNVANKQNVTGINSTGYIISGTNLNFNAGAFGIPNNTNSNFVYTPRQVQLGVRVKF